MVKIKGIKFGSNRKTLAQAARIAALSIEDFLDILKETDIDVVDYPEQELDTDLENIV